MTSFTGPPLNLQALSELLESNYFDPVLWSLYYTCRYFYNKKPRDLGKREIRIRNYRDSNVYKLCEELKQVVIEEKLLRLKGDCTALRDILIYNKAKPWYALMGVVTQPDDDGDEDDEDKVGPRTFYIIPTEWLPYVYVRRHKNNEWSMYLSKNKFCCRQVLVRGSVTVARRDNISIEEGYCKAENYFHIGVGECKAEIHNVLADVGIFINGQQLYERTKLIAEPYGKVREVIYALSVRDKIFNFGGEDLISGKLLRAIMKHLLVCCFCNIYVDKLIEMICNVLVSYDPLAASMESNDNADMIIDGAVPCFSYILDGDFVIMRRDAFNAALKALPKDRRRGVHNICHEIILPFFEKYYVNICPLPPTTHKV
jgi:hypothetical protein